MTNVISDALKNATPSNASTGEQVRTWARDRADKIAAAATKKGLDPEAVVLCLNPSARGQIHPFIVSEFNRTHSKRPYVRGFQPETPIVVKTPVVGLDGRTRLKNVSVLPSEVRAHMGADAKPGRLPNAAKVAVALTKV